MTVMRREYIIILFLTALAVSGCRKEFEKVEDVDFSVRTSAPVYKVGEPVVFRMSGKPDFITFYSGEVGNDYAYKDTDRILGCHMIGDNVTEMIEEMVLARQSGIKACELVEAVHPHPTMSEAVMEAVEAAYGKAIHG